MTFPVIIRSYSGDYHAHAVQWALDRVAHPSFFWMTSKFPHEQRVGIRVGDNKTSRIVVGQGDSDVALNDYRVFWNRRSEGISLNPNMHQGDLDFVRRETDVFLRSVLYALPQDMLWVNKPHASHLDQVKTIQLDAAVSAGLVIPDTLMTNHYEEVLDFYRKHNGDIIYKSFRASSWTPKEGEDWALAIGYTKKLEAQHLQQKASITAAPGIYQARVEKAYELRVTFMGHFYIAAKIHSNEIDGDNIDWRQYQTSLHLERVELPQDVYEKCLAIMRSMDIVFGCFDFIVRPDGEHVFLEVNQMGQFLWIEDVDPSFPMLHVFRDFLRSGRSDFDWDPTTPPVRLKEFEGTDEERVYEAAQEKYLEAQSSKLIYSDA